MAGEIVAVPVDPKTADSSFWRRYHSMRRARQSESRPDDPVRPDSIEEQRLRRENLFHVEHRYEIAAGDVMLAWFYGHTVKPGTADYERNRHLFWADGYVRPDHRRAGLGRSWLPTLLELMDRHGCTTVGFSTEEAAGDAFLNWLGAEPKMVGAENRLDASEVDWAMVRSWSEEGPRRSPETRLEIYDGPVPDSMLADFAAQSMAMLNTMPFEALDIGQIVVTPDHIRDMYSRMAMSGDRIHTILTREPDGTMSAMTEASWGAYRPQLIYQMFTGVATKARGRGLGKWIKAAMLLRLRDLYPDMRWIATDNVGSNAPMLAINRRLGFKEYRKGTEYQMSRKQLAAHLRRNR